MADELNKKNPSFDSGSSSESAPKPKTIGTPAPNVSKPKQTPTTKPQLAPKSSMPKKMTIKPGNPNLGESAPVGIQRKRFESDKHANKRLNKMFDETKAATLGVWNHDNTHPMAKPDSVKFNPKLNYKPSKEALEAANRKKIMNQGFGPNRDANYYANSPKGFGDTSKKLREWGDKNKIFIDEKSTKNYYDEEPDFWNVSGKKGGLYVFPNENGHYSVRSDVINQIADLENEDELFKYLEDWNKPEEPTLEQQFKDMKEFAKKQDEGLAKYLEAHPDANTIPPKAEEGYSGNKQPSESDERSKASELYGTDLNKQQGYDYDRLSKELDSGDMVNLDGGLLPYEYGFETNGYEDLAVDARKNPETGKYEVFMYPETEDGPVEEPDENYPNYEFDSFDDLKAFMENNYKKVETPKWDPMNEPGSGGVTKELVDFVRQQLKADGGLNDNFIDAYLNKMPQNSNQADYWKGKMKEAWEKKNGGKK